MATITEDYVSFETAKLLKEKGFDVYGDGSFGSSTKVWMEYSPFGKIRDISTSTPSVKGFPAPTLQMAMKWLREAHKVFISITYENDGVFVANLKVPLKGVDCMVDNKHNCWPTYEQAEEEAIRFCLENLI